MRRSFPFAIAAGLWACASAWAGPTPTPTPLPASGLTLPAAPVVATETDNASGPLRAAPSFDLITVTRTDDVAIPSTAPAWSGPSVIETPASSERSYAPLTSALVPSTPTVAVATSLAPAEMTTPLTPIASTPAAKPSASSALLSTNEAGVTVSAFSVGAKTSAATVLPEPSRQIIAPNGRGQVGTQTFAKELALARNGIYYFDFVSTTSGLRTDLVKTGALSVAASATRPFTLALGTFNASGASDFLNSSQFKASVNYSWTLVSASSVTGFASNLFVLDTAAFRNDTAGGLFSVDQVGNNLVLNFTPVPEPSTWALLGVGALLVAWRGRRVLPPR